MAVTFIYFYIQSTILGVPFPQTFLLSLLLNPKFSWNMLFCRYTFANYFSCP